MRTGVDQDEESPVHGGRPATILEKGVLSLPGWLAPRGGKGMTSILRSFTPKIKMKHFEKPTNLVVIFNQYVTCIFILELKLPTGFVGDNKNQSFSCNINFALFQYFRGKYP